MGQTGEGIQGLGDSDINVADITADSITTGAGTASVPAIDIGGNGEGFSQTADDTLSIILAASNRFTFTSSYFEAGVNGAFRISRNVSSGTVPGLSPSNLDTDTGIGTVSADNLSLIAGGLEAIRAEDPADLAATETSLWLYDLDNGALQQVTVGADDSGGAGFKVLRIAN